MTTPADALRAVTAALDALADALASGQPDRVLSIEPSLAAAVRELAAAPVEPREPRADLRAEARAVRAAMARCDRLGRLSADLERLLQPSYGGRTGVASASHGARTGVECAVSSIRGMRA
jgi:hypothetical protein